MLGGLLGLAGRRILGGCLSVGSVQSGLNGSFEAAGGTTVHARWKFKKGATKCRQKGNVKGKGLGVKIKDNQFVKPGQSIYLQRGLKRLPGLGAGVSRNQSIYAVQAGIVRYRKLEKGRKVGRVQITVEDAPESHPKMMEYKKRLDAIAEKLEKNRIASEKRRLRRSIVSEHSKTMCIHLKKMAFDSATRGGAMGVRKTWL
ncbi:hypothetical protein NDN08_006877 [Rhodosorus marinus]|uniref:50S ribosomal protein L27, chloroplastic n=1 Tax=Rhodosorus marinus TaxID=101924 RepID=A0AAV8ULP7_9RHOD|nr:hypothetical protein NDN08_006877 [Rhodosorus marinus]